MTSRILIAARVFAFATVLVSCQSEKPTAPVAVASLSIRSSISTLQYGETVPLTAVVMGTNGAPLTGRVITWSSSNDAVASISPAGVVTAGAVRGGVPETVTLTASSDGKSATTTLAITPIPVNALVPSSTQLSIYVGQTAQLEVTLRDVIGGTLTGRTVTWSSSAPSIATITPLGLVTAVAPGTATLTVTAESRSVPVTATIALVPVASATVTPSSANLSVGQTQQLSVQARDSAGNVLTGRPVTWMTSTPSVATVSSTGTVSAIAVGTATISASVGGQTVVSSIRITPAALSDSVTAVLNANLSVLATQGWVQSSIAPLNNAFWHGSIDWNAYEKYFGSYVVGSSFNVRVMQYLGYPVFWWGTTRDRSKLQRSLITPLATVVDRELPMTLAEAIAAYRTNAAGRSRLYAALKILGGIASQGEEADMRTAARAVLLHLIQTRAYLRTADSLNAPGVDELAMYLQQALVSLQPDRVPELFSLGARNRLWTTYGVFLSDNGYNTPQSLAIVDSLLAYQSQAIPHLKFISTTGQLSRSGRREMLDSIGWSVRAGGVNVFDITWLGGSENGFPPEVAPYPVPIYSLVVAHEIAHIVDAFVIEPDPILQQRKRTLINRTAREPNQYLRSMVQRDIPGFFEGAPQEFFASIANQWYANADRTIDLARARWDAGYREPMNQLAFFLDVISQGRATLRLPLIGTTGQLSATAAVVEKNASGLVTSVQGARFTLALSRTPDGLVTGFTYSPR
jgi:uncharacterized protein YjdB